MISNFLKIVFQKSFLIIRLFFFHRSSEQIWKQTTNRRSETSSLKSFIFLCTLIRNWKVIWCLRKMLFGSEMMIKKFTMCIGLAINLMLLYLNWNIIQLSRRKNFWCHSIEYKPALKLWPITLEPNFSKVTFELTFSKFQP